MNKTEKYNKLIDEMSICEKCINIKNKNGMDCSLINIYKNKEFSKNIPSIWTDWYNRLDSNVMIIGQDWGPYNDMNKFYNEYMKERAEANWKRIIEQEKSMTKKMLERYLVQSAENNNINIDKDILNKIYITNAIMCARKGDNYRGNNIRLKESTFNCKDFLKEQIDIVKPKIILTLGYYPLYSLSKIYGFDIEKNLTQTIKNYEEFKIDNFVIIPLYHPTAQISKEKQLEQYNKIWRQNDLFKDI